MDMGAGNGAESSGKDGKNYDVWKDMEKVIEQLNGLRDLMKKIANMMY